MSADYFGLGVALMCSSAAETAFDRELRQITERDVMSNPPAAIPPIPGAVAPVIGEDSPEDDIERARRLT